MKKVVYLVYALWAVLAVLSKIFLGTSWFVATSFIWLPLGVVFTIFLFLRFSVDLGNRMKRKLEKKETPTCENCLFGKVSQYDPDKRCLGEAMDENIHRPKVCKFHRK